MPALPIQNKNGSDRDAANDSGGGCGTNCGAGLEKIYPKTAVRYGAMNWIGEFDRKSGAVFKCGAKVVIQTDRGVELGQEVSLSCGGCTHSISREQVRAYVKHSGPEFYRPRSGRILREASPGDIQDNAHLNAHRQEDIEQCSLLAAQMNLDMKIVTVEHLFGGERVVYYFRSEERVDFRDLVRDLAHHHQTRIELRQVGARDEARLVADYEICGRECCCKNFLKKLRPVTMKMAKLQKSTLDPTKVSGRCGRLRCCLRYEHEGYEELAAKLPRMGVRVGTEFGPATIIDRQVLTQLVLVRTVDNQQFTIPLEELMPVDALPTTPEPAPKAISATEPDPAKQPPKPEQTDRSRPRRRSRRPRQRPGRDDAPSAADGKPAGPPERAQSPQPRPDPPPESPPPPNASGDGGEQRPARSSRHRRRRRRRGPKDGPDTPPQGQ